MLQEPWFTFSLILGGSAFLIAAVFVQDWLADRAAARRRARDASAHPAE
jgi:hypothetical protein